VRGKTFALFWPEGGAIMKLRRDHQELLFDIRPETFRPCPVGVGVWSFVDLGRLDDEELDALATEAWSTVAPRSLARTAARQGDGAASEPPLADARMGRPRRGRSP
jgi:hypothetical protein